ncbi:hypothetical protein M2232_003037 [Bradyrhizobium japonicum]|uniref:DUF4760 domain-containing protein n=1 Tax=Bradyrhizobium japonicum TaxID=375 RepID=UPI002226731B|nr:hypothetical protein [Bradyrhizobium japonicum]MCW2219505.1 hypothetical protein [Bradyrhizobium japonicum]MCW2344119.1 hypothetical protein [Bradyrhizobium japonicum]
MRNWHQHFNFQIVVLLVLGISVYLILSKYIDTREANALLAGIVGAIACFSAANFSHRADQRARATNSFEIGRRWDQEPLLAARDVVRGKNSDDLVKAVKANNTAAKKSVIHLVNFFWEMSAAIETGWTLEPYLEQKFRPSLVHYYPAIVELLDDKERPGASQSLRAINWLCTRWKV